MRRPGYYWVKYNGEWEIAKWYKDTTGRVEWIFFDRTFEDSDFEEIDERRILRDRSTYTLGIKTFDSEGKEIKKDWDNDKIN